MTIVQSLRNPKVQLAFFLLLIYLSALRTHTGSQYITIFILSVFFSLFFDLFFTYLKKKTFFIPYSAIITGVIISLICNPHLPWYSVALIAFIAIGAKQFLRVENHHIFNPAATGLVLGGIFLHQPVSWWAVSFATGAQSLFLTTIKYFVLIAPLFISAYRMRRYIAILTFLIFYVVLTTILNGTFALSSLMGTILDPTILFFAFVMLPDPMTSPTSLQKQLFYGGFVAALSVLPVFTRTFIPISFLPDGLLPFLLVGNLLFFRFW